MQENGYIHFNQAEGRDCLTLGGDWTVAHYIDLKKQAQDIEENRCPRNWENDIYMAQKIHMSHDEWCFPKRKPRKPRSLSGSLVACCSVAPESIINILLKNTLMNTIEPPGIMQVSYMKQLKWRMQFIPQLLGWAGYVSPGHLCTIIRKLN